jgi:membrane protease YdiL (CAAX protease family)
MATVACSMVSDRRKLIALALPVVVPAAMCATFTLSRRRFGDHLGYLAGFGAYWATCAGATIGLLSREDIRRSFSETKPRLGRPLAVGVVLFLWPPVGALGTRFLPEIRTADRAMVVTITGVGVTNAVLEELLWRGVYVTLWPNDPWLGWVWPALGFGAWHIAPQLIHRSSLGVLEYVVSATLLGLSWGWIAWRTRSLRWVSISHALTDSSGLRNAAYFLGA